VNLGFSHGLAVGLRVKDIVMSEGDRVHPSHPFSCRSPDQIMPTCRSATARSGRWYHPAPLAVLHAGLG
jgi:hypothetical protein